MVTMVAASNPETEESCAHVRYVMTNVGNLFLRNSELFKYSISDFKFGDISATTLRFDPNSQGSLSSIFTTPQMAIKFKHWHFVICHRLNIGGRYAGCVEAKFYGLPRKACIVFDS